jgi:hypothetical protein
MECKKETPDMECKIVGLQSQCCCTIHFLINISKYIHTAVPPKHRTPPSSSRGAILSFQPRLEGEDGHSNRSRTKHPLRLPRYRYRGGSPANRPPAASLLIPTLRGASRTSHSPLSIGGFHHLLPIAIPGDPNHSQLGYYQCVHQCLVCVNRSTFPLTTYCRTYAASSLMSSS